MTYRLRSTSGTATRQSSRGDRVLPASARPSPIVIESFSTNDGVRIVYERRGDGRQRVRLSRRPGERSSIHRRGSRRPRRTTRACVLGLSGQRRPDHADASTYTLERFAEDLDELRQELGDDHITVLAHSMGGFVALKFCLDFPDRCDQLILAGTWPTNVPGACSRRRSWPSDRGTWARWLVSACAWLFTYSWRKRSAGARQRLYTMPLKRSKRADHRFGRQGRARSSAWPPTRQRQREAAATSVSFVGSHSAPEPDVECPVLLLYGSRDAAAVAGSVAFVRHLPNTIDRCLPEIGHDPFFEDPPAAREAIESFLGVAPR